MKLATVAAASAFSLAMLLCGASYGATNVYNSSATFNAAVTNVILDDYENPGYSFIQSNAVMSAVLGETTYESTRFSNLNIIETLSPTQHDYCAGCNGSFKLTFLNTSISTANGVGGVGMDYKYNDLNATPDTAFVTFGDGSSADYTLGGAGYFGITSDLGIKSIYFGNSGAVSSSNFGIDNLAIGNLAAVPEPMTWTMLVLGFGTLGAVLRRRRLPLRAA